MSQARPAPIDRLVKALRRLPGVGEKTATRLAFFLLSAPESTASELGEAILRLRREVSLCEECFNLTIESPCEICRDDTRQTNQVCVVEEPADLVSIESSGVFRGRYHVLGGTLAPLDGVGPEALRVEPLIRAHSCRRHRGDHPGHESKSGRRGDRALRGGPRSGLRGGRDAHRLRDAHGGRPGVRRFRHRAEVAGEQTPVRLIDGWCSQGSQEIDPGARFLHWFRLLCPWNALC